MQQANSNQKSSTATDVAKFQRILVTDCGSTTTKALLFERNTSGKWFTRARGEAPTTVESPIADVTVGAINAFTEIEEISGIKILNDSATGLPFKAREGEHGIDLYLSTSSAGGGLQMLVAGVSAQYSASSAARAALGAGAIVMDTIAAEDQRTSIEWIDRLRHLKPDIVLLTGGTDGGAKEYSIEVAELLLQARPRPRFGATIKVPVIYAGNKEISHEITELLSSIADVSVVANVRADLDDEQIGPARDAVHELFLSHVMSHAPGYGKLLTWSPFPILPTPAAAGDMVQRYAQAKGISVLCADIGGATTDVFSVFPDNEKKPVFNRTVSANVGMSYSIGNVLKEAGIEQIARWLAKQSTAKELESLDNRVRNKMIRPTSIPQTLEDLELEQAVCREALHLSLVHHEALAVGETKRSRGRTFGEIFTGKNARRTLVNMTKLDMVIGSGGVLSHAPRRLDAAMMMIDGFGLKGLTEVCVDSVFMMPHLGVLASVNPEAAVSLFENECLVHVCHHIRPISDSIISGELAVVTFNDQKIGKVIAGQLSILGEVAGMTGTLRIQPLRTKIDVGAGKGEVLVKEIKIGEIGLILDGRTPAQYKKGAKK